MNNNQSAPRRQTVPAAPWRSAGLFCFAVSPMTPRNRKRLHTVRPRYPDTIGCRNEGEIRPEALRGPFSVYLHATGAMTCNLAAVNCNFITTPSLCQGLIPQIDWNYIELATTGWLHLDVFERKNMTQQLRSQRSHNNKSRVTESWKSPLRNLIIVILYCELGRIVFSLCL